MPDLKPASDNDDPLPGDDLADWQLWLATFVARWLPMSLEVLGLALSVGAVAWAVARGLQHYWTASLEIAAGLLACWFLWRAADFIHPIARQLFNELSVVLDKRQRRKDTRGYFLFLRSFRDDAFAVQQTVAVQGSSATVTVDNLTDLLEYGLEPYGRVIMIGSEASADPFSDSSVMARTDDANWWSVFTRLLSNARCVFLVPESSAGLIREFTEVLTGPYRSKALVIMSRADEQGRRPGRWEELRREFAQKGFDLPPYDPAGCFYLPDAFLRPIETFSFGNWPSVAHGMRRAFKRVAAKLPRGTTPFKEAIKWIDVARPLVPAQSSSPATDQPAGHAT